MMNALLQDWATLEGSGTNAFVQDRLAWLDLAPYADVILWLEVRGVANPGAGNVTLAYETAPATDDALFQALTTITLSASSTPVVTKIQLSNNPTVPLARYLRWRLVGTAAGDWSATFRISVATGMRSSGGIASPASLVLDGWWEAPYTGSPLVARASAGTSGTTGNLAEATNPPASGVSSLNGIGVMDCDGTNDSLTAAQICDNYATAAAGTILVLFNSDTAPADPGNDAVYNAMPIICIGTDSASNSCPRLGFTASGVRFGGYDGDWVDSSRAVSCTSGAWHMAKCRWGSGTGEVGVDSGAMTSFTLGTFVHFAGGTLTLAVSPQASHNGGYFNGKVAGIIAAKTALSDSDINIVKAYWNDKFALAL